MPHLTRSIQGDKAAAAACNRLPIHCPNPTKVPRRSARESAFEQR